MAVDKTTAEFSTVSYRVSVNYRPPNDFGISIERVVIPFFSEFIRIIRPVVSREIFRGGHFTIGLIFISIFVLELKTVRR